MAVAPIKSRAELVRHLREVRDSPLMRLPDRVCVIHGRVRECRPHYGYNCSRACDD